MSNQSQIKCALNTDNSFQLPKVAKDWFRTVKTPDLDLQYLGAIKTLDPDLQYLGAKLWIWSFAGSRLPKSSDPEFCSSRIPKSLDPEFCSSRVPESPRIQSWESYIFGTWQPPKLLKPLVYRAPRWPTSGSGIIFCKYF